MEPLSLPSVQSVIQLASGITARWSKHVTGNLLFDHLTPRGDYCGGVITFARHRLISRRPMTIEPSIMCMRCGNHGFIRDGAWIPADKYAKPVPA